MRLIDADALGVGRCSRELLPAEYCAGWNGLVSLIEQAPTIDAVEVVWCEKCRWWDEDEKHPSGDNCRCNRLSIIGHSAVYTARNGYCYLAERRDDNA